ncbi:MAG: nucleoside phosphorylase [Bacteroidota bacterium]|nr:MAG: nucleoside phosphorylase [Bacteroidota bacterium]
MIPASELLLTSDGSIYHLRLKPHQLAEDIILVGDPDRVEVVASFFDSIEFAQKNREFNTITGFYKGQAISVISTGIGIGNVDIVLNELDALANIDFEKRYVREDKKALNLVRIGTSGALQSDIPIGSYILSNQAIGFDGLMNFLENRNAVCDLEMEEDFLNHFPELRKIVLPYAVDGSSLLLEKLKNPDIHQGITVTAPGFYGSQGRVLRMDLAMPGFNDKLEHYAYRGQKITNYEMETSALYGYSKLLGHEAATICLALANRVGKEVLKEYKNKMMQLIEYTLNGLVR